MGQKGPRAVSGCLIQIGDRDGRNRRQWESLCDLVELALGGKKKIMEEKMELTQRCGQVGGTWKAFEGK